VDIVAIGEILIDFVATDSADLGTATAFISAAGGAPANVAVAASRLGARAALVGAAGDDPFGAQSRRVLEENGVGTSGLQTVKERTTLAFASLVPGSDADFLFYRGADAALESQMLPLDLIGSAACVYVSSMALLAEPARSATLAAIMHGKSSGALVAVDPNLRPSSWASVGAAREAIRPLLEHADVVKVNEAEALSLTGLPKIDAAVNALSGTGKLLVVTRGRRGCVWRWRDAGGEIDAPEVEVVDPIGAGDAFMGALLAELCRLGCTGRRFWTLRRDHLESTLRFACAAGAAACTRRGAIPALPTRDEVESLVISR